jgi:hypothetical protein
MVSAVWSSVLVLTLLAAVNPVRLGLALLVLSRPGPVQNLLAYGAGSLTASVPYMLIPLLVLHSTPMFRSYTDDWATSPTLRHIQIGLGALVLSIAALMSVRMLTRRRQRAGIAPPGDDTSVPDSSMPRAISRLLGRAQDAPAEGGSVIRRLLGRAHSAWENGSLWVAWLIGFLFGGPGADQMLYVLAIIVASGAAIGTQVSAAIAFIAGVLAAVEITLVSYLITPAKTQAVLRVLHGWARAHRQKIMVAMCTVGGVSLLAHGIGSI